ncbi:MAG: cobalamin-dependent protein [Candidatus Omnitrophica bacterium]|nr:cobalamin-dependent protein [Candidatus Omnitrophota bacterium]
MDIVLIKPNNQKKVFQALSEDFSGIEPPLWLILMAAYLRESGATVSVIDAEAENLSVEETIERAVTLKPVLVSVVVSGTNPSASTINMPGAGLFLQEIKKVAQDIPTVLCGLHPSALPEQTMKEEAADFVVEGEGFTTHLELVAALKSKKDIGDEFCIKGLWYRKDRRIFSNPRAENIDDLGILPMPAWDLLPMDKYRAHNWHCFSHIKERQPYAVIYTSLGCPFHCDFCCINSIFGKPGIRYRPPQQVVEEVEYLVKHYGMRNIKILDELFVSKWSHVEAICDGIIAKGLGEKLNFWAYGRIDSVKEHMLKKMKQAGINWLAYGIEAGSKKVRDGVTKGRFTQDDIKRVIAMTHDAGIEVVSNFIFGLPDDDMETMQETLDLAKELNCAYANLYCAMAYPGSKLYADAVQQGTPLPKSWSAYSQFSKDCLPLATKYLSGPQVLKFRDEAFDNYFTDPRYLARIEERFGLEAVNNIKKMCMVKLVRNNYPKD